MKRVCAGIQARDARATTLRGRSFDGIADAFISSNPGCTVIDLACGFNTRFWRIQNGSCKYLELDLPEVIELKREILKEHLSYELIGYSVLDTSWIDKVTSNGSSSFLLLAEGLFMYLPKQDATRLLQVIAQRFSRSQLVLDMVPEKYTRGLWKRLIPVAARLAGGFDVSFVFGISKPRDIEAYGSGFRFVGEARGMVGPIITVSINAA